MDNLLIVAEDPKSIIAILTDKYNFKLKGTGPVEFYLGCDFFWDNEGYLIAHLCYAPRKYIEKMLDNYKHLFGGQMPRKYASPLEKNYHPELDDSEFLHIKDIKDIKIYQSLIGALQWVIQIGRWDGCWYSRDDVV